MGTALFRREGRGVRLTEAGTSLARDVSADLDRLRSTFDHAIAAGGDRKVIRMSAPSTFSCRWLLPRLPAFKELHPEIEFIVSSRAGPYDLTEARDDLAIHFGGLDWPHSQLTTLCFESLVVVAAPTLLKPSTKSPVEHLKPLPRLHMQSRPDLWNDVSQAYNLTDEPVGSGSYFDQFSLVIAAAKAAMGAAILPTYLIESELKDGSLVKLLDVPVKDMRGYVIVTPLTPRAPLIKEFINWLKTQVS
ncbi:LysR substrate-binding domain-containing protein [Cognatishimia activa]|nr:LysR substrate-binding domain-containing protein [Cognatishimia activa]